jgi:metallo-beta-lactamase family protein
MREIKERKLVLSNPNFPVYVDSPLASEATKIFDSDLSDYSDEQTTNLLRKGVDPLTFPNLTFTDSTDDSKAINYEPTLKVIISSSGMCEAGRIRHHLKHNLWKKECSIIFVGFQANGTLGRTLLDGAKKVKIFDEEIAVLATIYNFTGLSAHADRDGLLKWINGFDKKPDKIFVVHGEDSVCDVFVKSLIGLGFLAIAPLYKTTYDLIKGELITSIIKEKQEEFRIQKSGAVSLAYANLLKAFEQLSKVIYQYEDASIKNLEKFTKEIIALSKKWNR